MLISKYLSALAVPSWGTGWVTRVTEYLYLATCAKCGGHKFKCFAVRPFVGGWRSFSSIFRWLTVAFEGTGFGLGGVGDSQTCSPHPWEAVSENLLEGGRIQASSLTFQKGGYRRHVGKQLFKVGCDLYYISRGVTLYIPV